MVAYTRNRFILGFLTIESLAQSVEHLAYNEAVGGSSPLRLIRVILTIGLLKWWNWYTRWV